MTFERLDRLPTRVEVCLLNSFIIMRKAKPARKQEFLRFRVTLLGSLLPGSHFVLELADAFHNHCQRLMHYVSMDNFTLWSLLIAD